MDLSTLVPTSDIITVLLKHPVTDEILKKDDGTEMSITVYAIHAKEYKAVIHEMTNKRMQKIQRNKKVVFSAEEIEMAEIEVLAKTTKEWDLQFNKKPIKFSVAEAIDLYQKFPWIKKQASEAQEDYTSFLKA
jgi:hypothetical protein